MIEIPPRPAWLKRRPTKTTDAAERAAAKYGVNPADVLALMPEALELARREVADRERAKARARQLTGLNARLIASRENRYLDHSTVCRFDETSREVAAEFPELGFDPDGHDTPASVWAFIAEGKQPIPCRHSDEVAELAASWCQAIELDDFPEDADGFDPSEFDDAPACDAHNPASDMQTKGDPSADETSSRDVCLPTPWHRSTRRNNGRREAARPNPGSWQLRPVRPDRLTSEVVRSDQTGRRARGGRDGRTALTRADGTLVRFALRSRDGPPRSREA